MKPYFLVFFLIFALHVPITAQTSDECSSPSLIVSIVVGSNDQLGFNPNKVNVNKGACVELDISNNDGSTVDHTFVLYGRSGMNGIELSVPVGQIASINALMPNEDVTLEFYCGITGHRDAGEVGTIIVGAGSTTAKIDATGSGGNPKDQNSDPSLAPGFEWIWVIPALVTLPLIKSKYLT